MPRDDRWTTVDQLFEAALKREPHDRAAFLRDACGDDGALRREVESLLANDANAAGFMSRPALASRSQSNGATSAGRQLGSYTLEAQLGVGGMGEVYRARDRKLGRDVAIKILPPVFTADPDRRARFDREARLLAALNHPHIGAIYGVEESDGIRALVLELVEGDTLAERLAKGPLPLTEALRIALQIADALDAAHEKGIVHRDLKPANVKITPGGVVKVLDFGLAKMAGGDAVGPDLTRSPTVTIGGTRDGMILGTAAYMSPEQARGKAVGKRADIWAFGCVLYEMLTGRTAFGRETLSDTIAAILEREPEWGRLRAPAAIRRLLQRCLEKDLRRRLHDIADARIEIEDALSAASLTSTETAAALPGSALRRPLWRRAIPLLLTAIVAGALAGTGAWYLGRGALTPAAVMKLSRDLPQGQEFTGATRHLVDLSADGSQFVYVANDRLYIQAMAETDAKVIQGSENHKAIFEPVFSPDGRAIVFYAFADRTLKQIPITGGVAKTVSAADNPTGISWGPYGIVFGQGSKGVMRVVPDSGKPEQLVRVNDNEVADGPQLLPGGRHVLFTVATGTAPDKWDKAQVFVQSIASGERTALVQGSDARYVPTGHIVYAQSGSLFAIAFDLQRLRVSGDPVRVVAGIRRAAGRSTDAMVAGVFSGAGAADFSFSRSTGTLIYVAGPPVAAGSALLDIVRMDRKGSIEPLSMLPPGLYTMPRVSPDGTRIAYGSDDGKETNVWIYDLSGTSQPRRLTRGGNSRFPIWTSGERVAFQSDREGDHAIFWQPADGKDDAERLTTPKPGESHVPESWSRTDDRLLYSIEIEKASDVSLWTISPRGGTPTPVGIHSSNPTGAVFSPDGRWLAYASSEGAMTTIYVRPYPTTGAPPNQLIAQGADTPKHPRWSPDWTELYFNQSATRFSAVSVTTQPAFAFGNSVSLPKLLQGGPSGTRTPYDVTPDGRFVGLKTAGQMEYASRGSPNQIQVILNWYEELKRLVPSP